jgi:hypothetical protein
MTSVKIDVTKIDKEALYKGAKGTYLNITLMDNREGKDQYENDGFVVQDIGKDRRQAGEKGPIIGNFRHIEVASTPALKAKPAPVQESIDDDIPF